MTSNHTCHLTVMEFFHLLDHFIPSWVTGRAHVWAKARSTLGWAFLGLLPCSWALRQCTEGVLPSSPTARKPSISRPRWILNRHPSAPQPRPHQTATTSLEALIYCDITKVTFRWCYNNSWFQVLWHLLSILRVLDSHFLLLWFDEAQPMQRYS